MRIGPLAARQRRGFTDGHTRLHQAAAPCTTLMQSTCDPNISLHSACTVSFSRLEIPTTPTARLTPSNVTVHAPAG